MLGFLEIRDPANILVLFKINATLNIQKYKKISIKVSIKFIEKQTTYKNNNDKSFEDCKKC